eukprot:TRINITY_DN20121_c0_g1_i1.p1 TRINITY_DN20121_c0_g1~~TRINITY_DN20121_c0_g1_i1.p1  ORF type:complete len:199 (+),score=20.43 TRINITY_DN20121_c0_g1_i1:20-616(+)
MATEEEEEAWQPRKYKADQILPWLYVGGDSYTWDALNEQGIKHIVNVRGGAYPDSTEFPAQNYHIVPLSDYGLSTLADELPKVFKILDAVKRNNQNQSSPDKVLVHCSMGMNRAPTTVIGYLVAQEGWTLLEAFEHVKKHRTQTYPQPNYIKQLRELEVEWKGTASVGDEKIETLFPPMSELIKNAMAQLAEEAEGSN